MSLSIEMEQIEDVAVLQCAGRIVRAEALRVLEDAVTSLSQSRVIVLDLSEVTTLDGGGLGTLVFLHYWTSANGIQLKLVNPSQLVRKMIELTGLTSVVAGLVGKRCCRDLLRIASRDRECGSCGSLTERFDELSFRERCDRVRARTAA